MTRRSRRSRRARKGNQDQNGDNNVADNQGAWTQNPPCVRLPDCSGTQYNLGRRSRSELRFPEPFPEGAEVQTGGDPFASEAKTRPVPRVRLPGQTGTKNSDDDDNVAKNNNNNNNNSGTQSPKASSEEANSKTQTPLWRRNAHPISGENKTGDKKRGTPPQQKVTSTLSAAAPPFVPAAANAPAIKQQEDYPAPDSPDTLVDGGPLSPGTLIGSSSTTPSLEDKELDSMMAPIVASIMEMADPIDPVPWLDEFVVEWVLGF